MLGMGLSLGMPSPLTGRDGLLRQARAVLNGPRARGERRVIMALRRRAADTAARSGSERRDLGRSFASQTGVKISLQDPLTWAFVQELVSS